MTIFRRDTRSSAQQSPGLNDAHSLASPFHTLNPSNHSNTASLLSYLLGVRRIHCVHSESLKSNLTLFSAAIHPIEHADTS